MKSSIRLDNRWDLESRSVVRSFVERATNNHFCIICPSRKTLLSLLEKDVCVFFSYLLLIALQFEFEFEFPPDDNHSKSVQFEDNVRVASTKKWYASFGETTTAITTSKNIYKHSIMNSFTFSLLNHGS